VSNVIQSGDQIAITGDLIFSTIVSLRKDVESAIKNSGSECVLDFSQVKRVDSSSVSLCLCCLRLAKQLKKTVHFTHLPADINAIAHLVGLETLSEL
jgi:phospholipid transport system transporter-binding protein